MKPVGRRVNRTPREALALMIVLAIGVTAYRSLEHQTRRDVDSSSALRQIATTFNRDYHLNIVGPVYDRWDASSQSIISKSAYVQRHRICPTPPGPALVQHIYFSRRGFSRVVYSIDGISNTDYWHYVDGQWRFSLWRSNPEAVHLYEAPFAQFARDVGCHP